MMSITRIKLVSLKESHNNKKDLSSGLEPRDRLSLPCSFPCDLTRHSPDESATCCSESKGAHLRKESIVPIDEVVYASLFFVSSAKRGRDKHFKRS